MHSEQLKRKQTEKASLHLASVLRQSLYAQRVGRADRDGPEFYRSNHALGPAPNAGAVANAASQSLKDAKNLRYESLLDVRHQVEDRERRQKYLRQELVQLPKISRLHANAENGQLKSSHKYYKGAQPSTYLNSTDLAEEDTESVGFSDECVLPNQDVVDSPVVRPHSERERPIASGVLLVGRSIAGTTQRAETGFAKDDVVSLNARQSHADRVPLQHNPGPVEQQDFASPYQRVLSSNSLIFDLSDEKQTMRASRLTLRQSEPLSEYASDAPTVQPFESAADPALHLPKPQIANYGLNCKLQGTAHEQGESQSRVPHSSTTTAKSAVAADCSSSNLDGQADRLSSFKSEAFSDALVEKLAEKYRLQSALLKQKHDEQFKCGYNFDAASLSVDVREVQSLLQDAHPPSVNQTSADHHHGAESADEQSAEQTLDLQKNADCTERETATAVSHEPLSEFKGTQSAENAPENASADHQKPLPLHTVHWGPKVLVEFGHSNSQLDEAGSDTQIADAQQSPVPNFLVVKSLQAIMSVRQRLKNKVSGRLSGFARLERERPIILPTMFEIVQHYMSVNPEVQNSSPDTNPRSAIHAKSLDAVYDSGIQEERATTADLSTATSGLAFDPAVFQEPWVDYSSEAMVPEISLQVYGVNRLKQADLDALPPNDVSRRLNLQSESTSKNGIFSGGLDDSFSFHNSNGASNFDGNDHELFDIDEFIARIRAADNAQILKAKSRGAISEKNNAAGSNMWSPLASRVGDDLTHSSEQDPPLTTSAARLFGDGDNAEIARSTSRLSAVEQKPEDSPPIDYATLAQAKQKDVLSLVDKAILQQLRKQNRRQTVPRRKSAKAATAPKKKIKEIKELLRAKNDGHIAADLFSGAENALDESPGELHVAHGSEAKNSEKSLGAPDTVAQTAVGTSLLQELFGDPQFVQLLQTDRFSGYVESIASSPHAQTSDQEAPGVVACAVGAAGNTDEELSGSLSVGETTPDAVGNKSDDDHSVGSAIEFLKASNYERAMVKLTLAIQANAKNADACWLRAQLYIRRNQLEAAIQDIDKLLEVTRTSAAAFWLKARLSELLHLPKAAIQAFSGVVRLMPDHVGAHFRRALLYEQEHDYSSANDDLRTVRIMDPTNTYAIANEAFVAFHKTLWEDAIVSYTRLLRLEPNNAIAFSYRGRAFAHLQRYEEALRDLNHAIRLDQDNADFYFCRGSLLRIRNPKRAMEDLSTALMLFDPPLRPELATAIYMHRAAIYVANGDFENALADYRLTTEFDPQNAEAFARLGDLYGHYSRRYKEALECYNACLEICPADVRTLMKRAEVHQQLHQAEKCANNSSSARDAALAHLLLGDNANGTDHVVKRHKKTHLDLAIRDYSIVLHLCPNHYLVHLHRGRLLLQKNELAQSSKDFANAFTINGSATASFSQRALVLLFQQKYQQIVDEFSDSSVALSASHDATAWKLVSKAKSRLGDYQGALQALSRANELCPNDPQICLQRGIAYFKVGDVSSAMTELSKSIKLHPTYTKALYYRGLYKLFEGNDRGFTDINKVIKLDPLYLDAFITRAAYAYQQRRYNDAVRDCNVALQLEPMSVRGLLLRSACYCKLQKHEAAVQSCTRALVINPDSYYALYNRASAHAQMGSLWKAVSDYSVALCIRKTVNAFFNRGLLYWRLGDYANSALDLERAHELEPTDTRIAILHGVSLQRNNRFSESLDAFGLAIKRTPLDKEPYLGRSLTYLALGDPASAVMDLQRVIHLHPTETSLHVSLAHIFLAQRDLSYAHKILSSVIQWSLEKASAYENRALVHYMTRNYYAALLDMDRAISFSRQKISSAPREPQEPDRKRELANFYCNKGAIYEMSGDYAAAFQMYNTAVTLEPRHSTATFNQASIYVRQRFYDKAIALTTSMLQGAVVCDPDVIVLRATAKALAQDNQGALDDLTWAQSFSARQPVAAFNRANLLQQLGRFGEAQRDFLTAITQNSHESGALVSAQ